MKLIDVYKSSDALRILYQLLEERSPEINISHRKMPTWEEHRVFVSSYPYLVWYLIEVEEVPVGAIYLSKQDEIGVFILQIYQGRGYARRAISMLMEHHPRERYLANINPENHKSIELFRDLGFSHIQVTYEKRKD